MRACDVVAVAHDGEFVCFDCCDEDERKVFLDQPLAQEKRDSQISPVFADQTEIGDSCGRCCEALPGCESDDDIGSCNEDDFENGDETFK